MPIGIEKETRWRAFLARDRLARASASPVRVINDLRTFLQSVPAAIAIFSRKCVYFSILLGYFDIYCRYFILSSREDTDSLDRLVAMEWGDHPMNTTPPAMAGARRGGERARSPLRRAFAAGSYAGSDACVSFEVASENRTGGQSVFRCAPEGCAMGKRHGSSGQLRRAALLRPLFGHLALVRTAPGSTHHRAELGCRLSGKTVCTPSGK